MKKLRRPKRFEDKVTHLPGGKLALDIVCRDCGKPVCVANKYGMFCEDHCGMEEAIKASKKLERVINAVVKGLP
jgi:hypothetical protein